MVKLFLSVNPDPQSLKRAIHDSKISELLLKVNVKQTKPYTIPANPHVASGARKKEGCNLIGS